jgi:hypothetical protein
LPFFLVFGWFSDSFVEVESSTDYTLLVGYEKRPQSLLQALSFDIVVIEETAGIVCV